MFDKTAALKPELYKSPGKLAHVHIHACAKVRLLIPIPDTARTKRLAGKMKGIPAEEYSKSKKDHTSNLKHFLLIVRFWAEAQRKQPET